MPELPEVETVCRGLRPHCSNQNIKNIIVRNKRLRWPISDDIESKITNKKILEINRRGKYILFKLSKGTLIVHLGMSGVLQIIDAEIEIKKHDHVDIILDNQIILRYNDPRRFGAILYTEEEIENHKLFNHLGPEPFSEEFNSDLVFNLTRNKKLPIKTWLMNASNVVGVGNIYASEILFRCNIHPLMPALKLTPKICEDIVRETRLVLDKSIKSGGTTLKDFKNAQGKPGYFVQELNVYGKAGKKCPWCNDTLILLKIAGRQTVYCPSCQPAE